MNKSVIDLNIDFPCGQLSPQEIEAQLQHLPYPLSVQLLFDDGKFVLRVGARQSASRLQSDLGAQVGPLLGAHGVGWSDVVVNDAGPETAESVLSDVLPILESCQALQGADRQQLDALADRIRSVLTS